MINQKLMLAFLAWGVSIGLTSCENKILDQDPAAVAATSRGEVEVSFDLNVGRSRADSSSTDSTTDDVDIEDSEGTYGENYINTDMIHVYFTDCRSTSAPYYSQFGGLISSEMTIKTAVRIDSHTYRISGIVSDLPSVGTYFRVLVTANWPYTPKTDSTPFVMCAAAGGEYEYYYGSAYPDDDGNPTCYTPSEDTPIPMYGVKQCDIVNSPDKTSVALGTISLIRAMAKLIVKCNNKVDAIQSVTLVKSHYIGMCGPCSLYDDSGTEELSSTDQLNIPTSTSSASYSKGYNDLHPYSVNTYMSNVPFKDMGDNRFLVYVPCFNNSVITGNYIKVTLDGYDYSIPFTDDDGATYNLMRNNMYIYDVEFDHSQVNYVVTQVDNFTAGDITFD